MKLYISVNGDSSTFTEAEFQKLPNGIYMCNIHLNQHVDYISITTSENPAPREEEGKKIMKHDKLIKVLWIIALISVGIMILWMMANPVYKY